MSRAQLVAAVSLAAALSAAPAWAQATYDGQGNLNVNVAGAGGTAGTGTAQPIAKAASTVLEASHVLLGAPGAFYSAYATNLTGAASANLLILNVTSKPVDGAVGAGTLIDCVPFSGNVASVNYANLPPAKATVGVTAVVSTAASCFTQTSSVATAFISGIAK